MHLTKWQYYLSGDTPERADEGKSGLIRVPVGAPVSLAEQLGRSGDWNLTDRLWRQKYLGSWNETTEIEQERAEQLMRRWVEIGRIKKLPSDESTTPPEIIAELSGMDSRADAIWHDVPTPPGAEDIATE
jgi:hypothetical protein